CAGFACSTVALKAADAFARRYLLTLDTGPRIAAVFNAAVVAGAVQTNFADAGRIRRGRDAATLRVAKFVRRTGTDVPIAARLLTRALNAVEPREARGVGRLVVAHLALRVGAARHANSRRRKEYCLALEIAWARSRELAGRRCPARVLDDPATPAVYRRRFV